MMKDEDVALKKDEEDIKTQNQNFQTMIDQAKQNESQAMQQLTAVTDNLKRREEEIESLKNSLKPLYDEIDGATEKMHKELLRYSEGQPLLTKKIEDFKKGVNSLQNEDHQITTEEDLFNKETHEVESNIRFFLLKWKK